MMIGLSLERAVANAVIVGIGWPAGVVPLQYVPLVLVLELIWLAPVRDSIRAVVGSVGACLAAYAYLVAPLPFAHVPVDTGSVALCAALCALFALGALALSRRWASWEERVPVIEWERYPRTGPFVVARAIARERRQAHFSDSARAVESGPPTDLNRRPHGL